MNETSESQLASTVLMIRPLRFEYNPLTAVSNRFQQRTGASVKQQQEAALQEFDDLVAGLKASGVTIEIVDDTPEQHTPDSVFPNNWISTHADGRVVLYPMEAENRRPERRLDIIEKLDAELGYSVREIVDLSHHERTGSFLEGTGSIVLDRSNRIAYACLSSRTHLEPLGDFAQRMDYEVVAFEAVDSNGAAIYHTNVLMNVGEQLAVICDAAIVREDQRSAVLQCLRDTGHDVISLSYDQLHAFAGNMLELRTSANERLVAMSQKAYESLSAEHLQRLEANGKVVTAPIDTIEASAGGSVRCMLAEVHLPRP